MNVLMKNVGNTVSVTLKNRIEYWGRMVRCDGYMNILLKNAKEYNNSGLVANYGDVFIRGNNVLYICLDASSPPKPRVIKGKERNEEEEEI